MNITFKSLFSSVIQIYYMRFGTECFILNIMVTTKYLFLELLLFCFQIDLAFKQKLEFVIQSQNQNVIMRM